MLECQTIAYTNYLNMKPNDLILDYMKTDAYHYFQTQDSQESLSPDSLPPVSSCPS